MKVKNLEFKKLELPDFTKVKKITQKSKGELFKTLFIESKEEINKDIEDNKTMISYDMYWKPSYDSRQDNNISLKK